MKEKYISRVDSEKSKMYGYLVRLYRGKGVLFQQWFPDREYGGKEKCFEAAKAMRDKKIVELNYHQLKGPKNREWKPVQSSQKPRSNTGHLGIYESQDYKKLKDGTLRENPYIAVSYVETKGQSRTKKFYIGKKRNREQALKEAVEFRNAKEISARIAAVEYNRELQKRLIEEENKLRKKVGNPFSRKKKEG
ncbi:MAG: hypothetical protein GF313_17460 [Caldithrix sp.]|nr:hypothetical protein [Caldithrix sp.]